MIASASRDRLSGLRGVREQEDPHRPARPTRQEKKEKQTLLVWIGLGFDACPACARVQAASLLGRASRVPEKDDSLARMRWYWECSHYRKELGDLILDRIFDHRAEGRTVPEDFGVLLTPANIEAHLARIREEQARYRTSHPEDVAEIEAIAQTAGTYP